MRPTFMGFETAKRAVFTNQKSLDITGNNLANAKTNGYTRQRVDRTSVPHSFGSAKVTSNRFALSGQGVDALGVSQTRDEFLDKRFREEYSKASYFGQSANVLADIQSALGDGQDLTDESGLYGAITELYKSLDDFAKNPTQDTDANIVLSSFRNMTQVLQQMDSKLTGVANQQIADMKVTVDRTNELLQQIAHLNQLISQDSTVVGDQNNEYFKPNELMDQRNLLLDELSSYGDIETKNFADGTISVSMGGKSVVNGKNFDAIVASVTNPGERDQTVQINWRSSGESVKLNGGTLRASRDYINGRGNNVQSANETSVEGVLYYRDRLDTFAVALTSMVNNSVPELDPVTKEPMKDPATGDIVYKTLLSGKDSQGKITAGALVNANNISISSEWTSQGAGYFIYNKNEREPKYAQQIAIQLTQNSYTFDSYGEKFEGSFAQYQANMVGKVGVDLNFNEGRQASSGLVADDFLDRRDSISGVNQDEETADMLMYQKSYEAAARLMTVLDDLLDVVINRMGRAGL